jgi:hypothetical protein
VGGERDWNTACVSRSTVTVILDPAASAARFSRGSGGRRIGPSTAPEWTSRGTALTLIRESPNAAKGAPHGFAPPESSCGSPTYMGRTVRSASAWAATIGSRSIRGAPWHRSHVGRNAARAAELFDWVDVILARASKARASGADAKLPTCPAERSICLVTRAEKPICFASLARRAAPSFVCERRGPPTLWCRLWRCR